MSEADRLRSLQAFFPGSSLSDMQRARGLSDLKNQMYGAIDPTEGDFYRPDAYNTTQAAEGIRLYEGDRNPLLDRLRTMYPNATPQQLQQLLMQSQQPPVVPQQ